MGIKDCVSVTRKLTTTENWCQRSEAISVTVPTQMVWKSLEVFVGRVQKVLEDWGFSSVVKRSPSKCKALNSIPSTTHKKRKFWRCRLEKSYNLVNTVWWKILVEAQKTRMLIRIWTRKASLRKFPLETNIPLAGGPEAMSVTLWQKICLHCPTLWDFKTEVKGNTLINLAREISRWPNIQAMGWVLLDPFNQIYSENWGQKIEHGKSEN